MRDKINEYNEKNPVDIVKSFEEVSFHVKNNVYWTEKIARYLAHCINGGLFCS